MIHDENMTNSGYSGKKHDTLKHVVKSNSQCVVFSLTSREYSPHRDLIVYSLLASRDLYRISLSSREVHCYGKSVAFPVLLP